MRFGISGLAKQSASEEFNRAKGFVPIQREDAEIVEGPFVLSVYPERRFIKIARGRGIALSKAKVAQREIGFCVFRGESVSAPKMILRRGKIVCFQSVTAGIVGLESPERGVVTRNRDKQRGERDDSELLRDLRVI